MPQEQGDSAFTSDFEEVLARSRHHRAAMLLEFARIPSVSQSTRHHQDVVRASQWLTQKLKEFGATRVDAIVDGGLPLVVGYVSGSAGAPTLLVYSHYDVQPGGNEEDWEVAPFEPFLKDGFFVGRGVADRKGQIIMYLSALEALRSVGRNPPVNLIFVFDGEEEAGSPTLTKWLAETDELAAATWLMVGEIGFADGNLPSITTSMRGIVSVEIVASIGPNDLLAGNYSGIIQNPANALSHVLAQLSDVHGRITIPGVYDDVLPLSISDRHEIAEVPFDQDRFLAQVPATWILGEGEFSIPESRAALPALDINGLWSGYSGKGSRAMIPADAHAKVSIRLVPNQEPQLVLAQLRDYVSGICPSGVEFRIIAERLVWPTSIDRMERLIVSAQAALSEVYGVQPVLIRSGGTLPVLSLLERQLGIPLLMLGFTQPNTNEHGPDERFLQENFESGTRAVLKLWEKLGQPGAEATCSD